MLADELEQVASRSTLTDDRIAGPLEQAREALTKQNVVVSDDDANDISGGLIGGAGRDAAA